MRAARAHLSEVAIINPSPPRALLENEEAAFIPMAAVDADKTQVATTEVRRISELKNGYSYFADGDILFAKITPCFENGKIAVARIVHKLGFGSTEFHVVRPIEDKLDSRFLVHFLRQRNIRLEGESRMTGSAGQRRVPKDFLEKLVIPLPSIEEQRRIAAILDTAEMIRAKRRAAIAKLGTLAEAIFIEMFGDPLEVSTKYLPLGKYLDFITSGGRGWAKFYAPSGRRFIRSLDVRMNHISTNNAAFVLPPDNAEARRTRVESGDVLLTITGSLIGRVAPVPDGLGPAYISQHVAILRLNREKLLPVFLSLFLSLASGGQRQIAKAQYGQTKPGLNFEQIRKFRVPVPPMAEQESFCHRIAQVSRLQEKLVTSLNHLDCLCSSLQRRTFEGEL